MAVNKKVIDSIPDDQKMFESLQLFRSNIEGLRKSLTLSLSSTVKAMQKNIDDTDKYIQKFAQKKVVGKKVKYKLHFIHKQKLEALQNEFEIVEQAARLLPRSIFVSMVTQLDLLIASHIRAVLEKHPTIISKEKSLTYEEAVSFTSLEDIRSHFVDDEIDSVLRASHADHLDWFEKKLGIKLKDMLGESYSSYIELTERRNLFVHTDGVVSSQYIRVCKKFGYKFKSDTKKGSVLDMDPSYYKEAFNCIFEVALKLSWSFYRKIYPNKIVDIDGYFSNFAISVVRDRSTMSDMLLSFMLENCEGSRDYEKNLFVINLALCKKISGNTKVAIEILDSKDWSSVNAEFRLANSIIRDDYDEACNYMLLIDKKSELIRQESYHSDPLYDLFRKTDIFKSTYRKIFKEEYLSVSK